MAKALTWSHLNQDFGPILLEGFHCTGNELSLEECPHKIWEQHNCDPVKVAGVSCNPYTGQSQGRKHALTHTFILDNTVRTPVECKTSMI